MADILAIGVILTALGLAYPALLSALQLFFPARVDLARARLESRPWRCLWSGLGLAILVGFPAGLLAAAPAGLFKFLGWALISLALAAAALGAAALAQILEARLAANPSAQPGPRWIRGAFLLELAAIFPIIGWFLFIPITTLAAFGAAVPAILGKAPHPQAALEPASAPAPAAQS